MLVVLKVCDNRLRMQQLRRIPSGDVMVVPLVLAVRCVATKLHVAKTQHALDSADDFERSYKGWRRMWGCSPLTYHGYIRDRGSKCLRNRD